MPKRRWIVQPAAPPNFSARFPEFSPLLAQIFFTRGITTHDDALRFVGDGDALGDPFLMNGMSAAVERIRRAISTRMAYVPPRC
jgi:hypothetical protein